MARKKNTKNKDYVSTSGAARFFKVSQPSVNRWIREGKLQATMTPGGHHRISRESLLAFARKLEIPISEMTAETTKTATVRILIVDDEESARKLIREFLRSHFPQVEIDEASDGFTAGMMIHSFKPNLVILDIKLPGIDGYAVCELIRKFPELKEIRILAMSGHVDAEMKGKILNLGANDFISKPFELNLLSQKIAYQIGIIEGRHQR